MRVPQSSSPGRALDDASIPLLTERLPAATAVAEPPVLAVAPTTVMPTSSLPPLDFDITLPQAASALQGVLPQSQPQPAAQTWIAGLDKARFEAELREKVLRVVAEQLPRHIEKVVRQQVSEVVSAALRDLIEEPLVARLTEEARTAITSSLRTTVEQAVQTELARVRAPS